MTRNHIRKKLNVPTDQDLQKFLINLLIEKELLLSGKLQKRLPEALKIGLRACFQKASSLFIYRHLTFDSYHQAPTLT